MDSWIVVAPVAKTAVAAVLLPAGVAKLLDRDRFVGIVRGFAILPKVTVRAFAAILPAVEVVVGVALLIGTALDWFMTAWAGVAAMALFAMFAIAIAINLIRGRADISCGCFGKSGQKLSWGLVGRACVCLAICVLTLPSVHRGTGLAGNLQDRVSALLIGIAVVAVFWLGRFVLQGTTAFEPGNS